MLENALNLGMCCVSIRLHHLLDHVFNLLIFVQVVVFRLLNLPVLCRLPNSQILNRRDFQFGEVITLFFQLCVLSLETPQHLVLVSFLLSQTTWVVQFLHLFVDESLLLGFDVDVSLCYFVGAETRCKLHAQLLVSWPHLSLVPQNVARKRNARSHDQVEVQVLLQNVRIAA